MSGIEAIYAKKQPLCEICEEPAVIGRYMVANFRPSIFKKKPPIIWFCIKHENEWNQWKRKGKTNK